MAEKPKLECHSIHEAHGWALATWQHVETSLYHIVHCALRTDERLSSIMFFHLRSPTEKVKITTALVKATLPADTLETHWKPIRIELDDLVTARNHFAHYELQATLEEGRPHGLGSLVLTEPYHDIKSHERETVRAYDQGNLETTAQAFRAAARTIMTFAERHYGQAAFPKLFRARYEDTLRDLVRRAGPPPKG